MWLATEIILSREEAAAFYEKRGGNEREMHVNDNVVYVFDDDHDHHEHL